MPSWAVINYFIEIELDRAGDVKAAGVRCLRQRHQIALGIAGAWKAANVEKACAQASMTSGADGNFIRLQENIVGVRVA